MNLNHHRYPGFDTPTVVVSLVIAGGIAAGIAAVIWAALSFGTTTHVLEQRVYPQPLAGEGMLTVPDWVSRLGSQVGVWAPSNDLERAIGRAYPEDIVEASAVFDRDELPLGQEVSVETEITAVLSQRVFRIDADGLLGFKEVMVFNFQDEVPRFPANHGENAVVTGTVAMLTAGPLPASVGRDAPTNDFVEQPILIVGRRDLPTN